MNILEAIGTHLAANGHGSLGSTIWLGKMQDAGSDTALCVYEYEGQVPVETMKAGVALERPRIQIVCRAGRDDYPAARDACAAARATLLAVTDQTLSGIRVLRIKPAGNVMPLPLDTKDRPRIAASFEVIYA